MTEFLKWLQTNRAIDTISGTGWMYAICEVAHYFSLFVLVGSAVLVDLRVIGVAARRQTAADLAADLFPWTWTALSIALVSGFIMFCADATHFFPDAVFRVKMAVMVVAIVFSAIVQRGVPKWEIQSQIPTSAKLIAVISLVLWIATILAGVEIAGISSLG
jgi:hypothetical protein